jgi:penicillin G amidase
VKRRWLARAGVVVTGVALTGAVAASAALLYLRRSLPELTGAATVSGLERPVDIVRDRDGVAHVFAANERDAQFALGYVHAQERLWQLELHRRLGAGTLSAVFGEDALESDRFFRTLGLRARARDDEPRLESFARAALRAYTDGINAFIAEADDLPPEFVLLGIRPEPFDPTDALLWLKVMAWSLGGNSARELDRLRLASKLSGERIAQFFREPPLADAGLRELYGALAPGAGALGRSLPERPSISVGSNNWVVDGRHTTSGSPLLANDPHLDLTAPSLWYLAHLNAPDLDVIGASMPGLPGIILGRNRDVAWAFTNTESDTQDWFIERLDPGDPDRYLTPSGSQPFTTRSEPIAVKGGPDQLLVVRESRHGPILSDADPAVAALLPPGTVFALAWAALAPGDRSVQFPLRASHARDAAALREAARDFHAPQQNIVYADRSGVIGFIAAGRVPVRHEDNAVRGTRPVPGWLERYDWTGFVPFDELPASDGAATGRIVTANQDITPPGYRHWLTSEWAAPHRARRIEALLGSTPRHDVQSFARIQLDVASGAAAMLLPFLLKTPAPDDTWRPLLERLSAWDLRMDPERLEPLVFASWLRQFGQSVCEDELGDQYEDLADEIPEFLGAMLQRGGDPDWCNDHRTPDIESCSAASAAALRRTLSELEQSYGSDWSKWSWGRAHEARAEHAPFGGNPWLGPWFDVRVAAGGDNTSVNVGAHSAAASEPFTGRYGPGYRAIYDLADPERSVFIITPGQSGHALSARYRDWSARWAQGEYVPMRTERAAIEDGALGTLRLTPRR